MIKKLFIGLLACPVIAVAQQKPYDFKAAEASARKLVYTSPDSALVVIKTTLSQKGNLHDTIKANTYNLYGIYYAMAGKSDSSLLQFNKAIRFSDGYPGVKVRALMNLATAYRNKGEYQKSLQYLDEALKIHRSEKNNVGIGMVYGEMASNYNYMLRYDKSVDYLMKAVKLFKQENNRTQLVAVKQKLANTYLAMENFRFAADLYLETLPEFREIGMEKNYYLTNINLGEAYIRMEQFDKAKEPLNIAVEGMEKFGDRELLGIAYSKIANIQMREQETAQAIRSFQKAFDYLTTSRSTRIMRIGGEYINLLNDNGMYAQALRIISRAEPFREAVYSNTQDLMVYVEAAAETYAHTGNPQKAYAEYRNTIALKDSISEADTKAAVQEIQAKFQTELQREKNIALEANNRVLQQEVKNEKTRMLFYLLGSVALIGVILAFLRSYWLKTKLQREQLKTAEVEKAQIAQQQKHEQQLINTQQEIIDEKQRELTASAIQMADYQNSISSIAEKCEDSTTDLKKVRRELLQLLRQQDYWKQFETRFNTLHPEFAQNLGERFEKLTKNDIEFCSLLKLNLTNKEIASLLGISHESAITKKYRIKKKMEISDDTEFERLISRI